MSDYMYPEPPEIAELRIAPTKEEMEDIHGVETLAYKRGCDDTRKEAQAMIDNAYQKGLEEAWICARKIS